VKIARGNQTRLRALAEKLKKKLKHKITKDDFKDALQKLEAPLSQSRPFYDRVIENIFNSARQEKEALERLKQIQTFGDSTPHTTHPGCDVDMTPDVLFMEIYKDAIEAQKTLAKMINCSGWVDSPKNVDPIGYKSEISARRKWKDKYQKYARKFKDLARITVVFTSCQRMQLAIETLLKKSDTTGLTVVQLKNKYANVDPMGYRDFNLTVQVELESGKRHNCEVQVNLAGMLEAKESAGHYFYETKREHIPGICQLIEEEEHQ
jgi:hypothetical protein